MSADLKACKAERDGKFAEEAIKSLQDEKLLSFVLVTSHEGVHPRSEAFNVQHSHTRYDSMVGMLSQAAWRLNEEMFEPDRE